MPPKPRVARFPGVMLAHTWTADIDPSNWWMSEKLDGVRAIWNGEQLVTRNAVAINAPDWFTASLPQGAMLDGELWMGRGKFQMTSGIVRRNEPSPEWRNIGYKVFDIPMHIGHLRDRYSDIVRLLRKNPYASPVSQHGITSKSYMLDYFAGVIRDGGEGLIIRDPDSIWIPTRSTTMLKVKSCDECDAIVYGHDKGEGRNENRLGALVCVRAGDITRAMFGVGTGLSDSDRENPPAIGATVRVGHNGFTDSGVPRFPVFLGERADCKKYFTFGDDK